MPIEVPVPPAMRVRSLPPQEATAWARLEQPRSVRAGRSPFSRAAALTRRRYAVRPARLRAVTAAVTSATTGWSGVDAMGGPSGAAVVKRQLWRPL